MNGMQRGPRVILALFMLLGALGLSACGDDEPAEEGLPAGVSLPEEYRYHVLIGEANGATVHVYTNTLPEITSVAGVTVVTIDGPTFCPRGYDKFGNEPEQVKTAYRNNYCSGDGVYRTFQASVGNNRTAILDLGE